MRGKELGVPRPRESTGAQSAVFVTTLGRVACSAASPRRTARPAAARVGIRRCAGRTRRLRAFRCARSRIRFRSPLIVAHESILVRVAPRSSPIRRDADEQKRSVRSCCSRMSADGSGTSQPFTTRLRTAGHHYPPARLPGPFQPLLIGVRFALRAGAGQLPHRTDCSRCRPISHLRRLPPRRSAYPMF